MTPEQRLITLGLVLPDPPPPPVVPSYVPWVRTGDLVVTAGQVPVSDGELRYTGRLGDEHDAEAGYRAARLATLNALAHVRAAVGGLSHVRRIVRLEGNVCCTADFDAIPRVVDGGSELLTAAFRERGEHTRSALGMIALPAAAIVQISLVAEVAT